jgi:hypothetical protein
MARPPDRAIRSDALAPPVLCGLAVNVGTLPAFRNARRASTSPTQDGLTFDQGPSTGTPSNQFLRTPRKNDAVFPRAHLVENMGYLRINSAFPRTPADKRPAARPQIGCHCWLVQQCSVDMPLHAVPSQDSSFFTHHFAFIIRFGAPSARTPIAFNLPTAYGLQPTP